SSCSRATSRVARRSSAIPATGAELRRAEVDEADRRRLVGGDRHLEASPRVLEPQLDRVRAGADAPSARRLPDLLAVDIDVSPRRSGIRSGTRSRNGSGTGGRNGIRSGIGSRSRSRSGNGGGSGNGSRNGGGSGGRNGNGSGIGARGAAIGCAGNEDPDGPE